jgi:biopolymer transport protein ExbB/TolQ
MVDMLLTFLEESSSITIFVMGLLSIYFIAINWLFIMRYITLRHSIESEDRAFQSVLSENERVSQYSFIHRYVKVKSKSEDMVSENLLKLIKFTVTKEATRGLSILSIVASTSPFIGLFGTVVSILETFSTLGDSELGAISVIAQGVSEALIATAVGIFVATFAYSYHQLLKRKAYELVELIAMQSELILLGNKTPEEVEMTEVQISGEDNV